MGRTLVYGRIAGRAAAEYSAGLAVQQRSPAAVRAAETDVSRLLAADGEENVRALLRSVRHLMTEHAGVVRDETGLTAGLAALAESRPARRASRCTSTSAASGPRVRLRPPVHAARRPRDAGVRAGAPETGQPPPLRPPPTSTPI